MSIIHKLLVALNSETNTTSKFIRIVTRNLEFWSDEQNSIELEYRTNDGEITWTVEGLPESVSFDDSDWSHPIFYCDGNISSNASYTVQITATGQTKSIKTSITLDTLRNAIICNKNQIVRFSADEPSKTVPFDVTFSHHRVDYNIIYKELTDGDPIKIENNCIISVPEFITKDVTSITGYKAESKSGLTDSGKRSHYNSF